MIAIEEQTHELDLIERVRTRYQREMDELRSLGFRELCFLTEALAPFSMLTIFPALIMMWGNGEVMVSKPPLRLAAAYSLLVNREPGTYAQPMGMGVKFYSGFADGMAVVTSNFVSRALRTTRLVKTGQAQSVPMAWTSHRRLIEQLRSEGRELRTTLAFDDYRLISRSEMDAMTS